MQLELFQNFVNSIPSLTHEQWDILDRTLLNARTVVEETPEPTLENRESSSKKSTCNA